MTGIFAILLFLTIGVARFASQRYTEALKAGARHAVPGGQNAREAVQEFWASHGLEDVQIKEHSAMVSNYYDAKRRCLFLTRQTAEGTDAGSWATALHEAAHALQEGEAAKAYLLRQGNIQITRYAPAVVAIVCLILMVLKRLPFPRVLMICSVLWAAIMLFNVLSLPVEFNASQRAFAWLEQKLKRHPSLVDTFCLLLPRMAWRDTGVFLRSPAYLFFGLLPVGGRLRPK